MHTPKAWIVRCRARRQQMIRQCSVVGKVIELVDEWLGPLKVSWLSLAIRKELLGVAGQGESHESGGLWIESTDWNSFWR